MIYLILLFSILLIGLISYLQTVYNKDKLFLILSYCPITLVMGLRGVGVGVDTLSYIKIYEAASNASVHEIMLGQNFYYNSIDKGYLLWNKLISFFSLGNQAIVLANSMLIVFLFFLFFKKNSKSVFISVFLFLTGGLYFASFNLMRQMIAIAILINSLPYFKEKKYVKTFILFFLALTFHSTSFVFIFVYLINFIDLNKKRITVLFFSIIIFSINYLFFISKFVILFPKFQRYLGNNGVVNSIGGISLFLAIDLLVILISIYFFCWKDSNKIYFNNLMVFIYIIFIIIGSKFNYFDRVALIFRPYETLIIPDFLLRFSIKYRAIMIFILLVLMSFFLLVDNSNFKPIKLLFFLE